MKLNTRSILERLDDAQTGTLRRYLDLLRERAVPVGLVAESDTDRLWERHVLDSLRGAAAVQEAEGMAFDLGSGAGLPGIPLAVALPAVRFELIEPKRRRAAFLELAVERLNLRNVFVLAVRAEAVDHLADLCLARAVAGPAEAWRTASGLLSERGRLLYWAGQTWGENHVHDLASAGVTAEICLKPEFQWQGPLVTMTRSSTSSSRTNDRA